MGMPVILVDSNMHAFTHKIGEQRMGYIAIYSCVLSLGKGVRKYYAASSSSYKDILLYGKYAMGKLEDFAEVGLWHL